MRLHRQEGGLWVPGPNVGVRVPVEGAEAIDVGAEAIDEEGVAEPLNLPDQQHLPLMIDLQSTQVPTLKWCPKAARGEFARELASLCHQVAAQPEQVRNWTLQAMFVRCILPAGRGPRAGDAYSQARLVRERLRRWRAGEFLQLWDEAVELTRERPRQGRQRRRGGGRRRREQREEMEEEEQNQARRNAERATILAQEGQYTKALQALTSAGMAPPRQSQYRGDEGKTPPCQRQPKAHPNHRSCSAGF